MSSTRYKVDYPEHHAYDLGDRPNSHNRSGTNTYLVGRGPQRLLIDTGEGLPIWSKNLKALLTSEKATVHKALLTHWHHDHVKGVPDLKKICPGVEIYKHDPDTGMSDITDGQEFKVEGVTLRAFHTPGHTEDHMAFVLEEEGAMFTGDSTFLFPLSLIVVASCGMV